MAHIQVQNQGQVDPLETYENQIYNLSFNRDGENKLRKQAIVHMNEAVTSSSTKKFVARNTNNNRHKVAVKTTTISKPIKSVDPYADKHRRAEIQKLVVERARKM